MKKFSRREFIPLAGLTLIGTSCLSNASTDSYLASKDVILPQQLKKGDLIGVCAPAGGIKSDSEITEFEKVISDLGYQSIIGEEVAGRYGYFSATDEERAASLMKMFENPKVKAIFFIRGGWGCARILDMLDYDVIKNNPKIVMGFSDITSLLIAIHNKTGLITFHGPGGNSSWNDFSIDKLQNLLKGKSLPHYSGFEERVEALTEGQAQGELVGGNLSIICSLIGTDYEPDWNGKILFLEEVAEEPYRIDRMLTQLKMVGVFDKIAGLALGGFRKCVPEEPDRSFTLDEVFNQQLKGLKIPVIKNVAFGHVRYKYTIPIGAQAEINTSSNRFDLVEPVVSA